MTHFADSVVYVPFVLRIRCDYIIVAALFSFMHVYRRGER